MAVVKQSLRQDLLQHVPAEIPTAGLVVSTILSMFTFAVLAVCLTRRIQSTKDWSKIPLTRWLVLAIYTDSMVFIFTTAILEHGFGLNSTQAICSSAILLCLVCYMSTKVLIYYFLVEKVYIIRRVQTPRLKSKLYCFNCFAMLLPYCIVVVLNFVYRIAYFHADGTCLIGMEARAMLPLIIFDAIVNLYLTLLFVLPLRTLYSYKNSPNSLLRTIAIRSFVGSLATLTSSVVNLTVLMVLKGEAAWICLMCCNADILLSVLVLHWVTSKNSNGSGSSAGHSASLQPVNGNRGLAASALDPLSPHSLVDKLHTFEMYSGANSKDGQVTTHISARDVDDDLYRLDSGSGGGLKKARGAERTTNPRLRLRRWLRWKVGRGQWMTEMTSRML
ncbi:uncharacterized protein LY89DRAFT_732491 [Mollisia scopiformis]|uniref:Uncharacterized protein n=1 Tax=Mollisia scopiformis TaxID=149040 RepID=A0A194XFQ3_MOLSC|nr:uncharacterized protein LY89DRAFT_732491 [Mollisia scopiformis]KUJ18959.1 hypothetical protein LY89DRAFT_732491 [Mollisia scopiformis]